LPAVKRWDKNVTWWRRDLWRYFLYSQI